MSLGLFNCRLIQPAGDQLFLFAGCLAAPAPVRGASVQSPWDASCSAPTSGRAQNASCFSFSERFCFGFQRGPSLPSTGGFTPTDSPYEFPRKFPNPTHRFCYTAPLCNAVTLPDWIDSIEEAQDSRYEATLAVIQSISTIRKGRKKREPKDYQSRGAKLKALEDSIANLDNLQGHAVIETVEGVLRLSRKVRQLVTFWRKNHFLGKLVG